MKFDCTPEQYHHGLDILWKALNNPPMDGRTVYARIADRIAELEAEVEQERAAHLATLKRVEWSGSEQAYSWETHTQFLIPCCPDCLRAEKYKEHSKSCQIAAEIKRLEAKCDRAAIEQALNTGKI